MLNNDLTYLIVGILLGIIGDEGYKEIREKIQPPMTPDELDDTADEMRLTAKRASQTAEVAERLAHGDDPDEIMADMPPEVRADWERFMKQQEGEE